MQAMGITSFNGLCSTLFSVVRAAMPGSKCSLMEKITTSSAPRANVGVDVVIRLKSVIV